MSADNPIAGLLAAPLSPDWTIEGLAEQVLGAIAAQRSDDGKEFVLDAAAVTDRQSRRLLRPLLACLATKSAAEAGTPVNLYGGRLLFNRPGSDGPVWVIGQFENKSGAVRVVFRRSSSLPQYSLPITAPVPVPTGTGSALPISQVESSRPAEGPPSSE
jgi:hypothetical protein